MTDQEKLFALMAHADDLQTHAQKMQAEAGQAIKSIPGEVRAAIGAEVHRLMEKEMENAKTALREATTALAHHADELESLKKWPLCTMLIAVLLFFGALLGVGYYWLERGRELIAEQTAQLESLKASIQTEKATLAEMKSKTWGLSLYEDPKGRFIVLPKGIRVDTETWTVGKNAAIRLVK